MPRLPLAKEYLGIIESYAHYPWSNYQLTDMIAAVFTEDEQRVIGQDTPSETTVRRYRNEYRKKIRTAVAQGSQWSSDDELDTPWRLQADDPDGISSSVGAWIIDNILTNDFIMRDRGLNYPKFNDPFDAVTRRIVKWISTLIGLLEGEHPQLIWSIAWMYSGHEMARTNGYRGTHILDTRAFDYYVSCRPWRSEKKLSKIRKSNKRWTHHRHQTIAVLGTSPFATN